MMLVDTKFTMRNSINFTNKSACRNGISFRQNPVGYNTDIVALAQRSDKTNIVTKSIIENIKKIEDILPGKIIDSSAIIDSIALAFEKSDFLEDACSLHKKNIESKISKNADKKTIIDSYVNLQRVYEKLNKKEEVEEIKRILEIEALDE